MRTSLILGCLWYYGTGLDQKPITVQARDPVALVSRLLDRSEHDHRKIAPLGGEPAPDADYKLRSDWATSLLYRGVTERAIAALEKVEKDKPGEYIVASNLGTAYELAGNNEKALYWIREGLRRNPDSHEGTEWLHVRILEAKIALSKDPDWLKTHTVLGVDFGADPVPASPAAWPPGQTSLTTQTALTYQLHERMGFIPAPDPVVADLLTDLGNLQATGLTIEHGLAIYDLAMTYKPVRADALQARIAKLREMSAARIQRQVLKKGGIVAAVMAGAAALAFLAVWAYRKTQVLTK